MYSVLSSGVFLIFFKAACSASERSLLSLALKLGKATLLLVYETNRPAS